MNRKGFVVRVRAPGDARTFFLSRTPDVMAMHAGGLPLMCRFRNSDLNKAQFFVSPSEALNTCLGSMDAWYRIGNLFHNRNDYYEVVPATFAIVEQSTITLGGI